MIRLLLPLLLIGGAIAGFFYLTDPWMQEVNTLKVRRDELQQVLDTASQSREIYEALLADYNNITSDQKARLKKLLPDHIDNVRLIIEINSIARGLGLVVKNISVHTGDQESAEAGEQTPTEPEPLGVNFAVTASYDQLKILLNELANSLRVVDVVSLGFTSVNESPSTYNVELQTYWLKT